MPSRQDRSQSDKLTESGDKTDHIQTWDHSTLTQRPWLHATRKRLNSKPNHKSYATGNYCSSGKATIVMSAEHAAAIADGTVAGMGHTMLNPMPTNTFAKTATKLPEALEKRFTIAPELLDDERELFITDILSTMEDDTCIAEYRDLCSEDPCKLLRILEAECRGISGEASQKALAALQLLIAKGPDSADIPSFNSFKSRVDSLNRTVHADDQLSDKVLAGHLVRAVNKLGKEVARDLKAEVRHLSAEGNLRLSLNAIRKTLDICQLDETGDEEVLGAVLRASGKPLPRSDPRFHPEPDPRPAGLTHPDRPYKDSDGACRHCGKLGH